MSTFQVHFCGHRFVNFHQKLVILESDVCTWQIRMHMVIYCTFDTLYETNSKTGQMGSLTLKSRLLLFIFCIFKADEGLQYHM